MPRRPATLTPRRLAESGVVDSFSSAAAPLRSRRSPLLSVCLVLLGVVILLVYSFSNSSFYHSPTKDTGRFVRDGQNNGKTEDTFIEAMEEDQVARPECRTAVCQALPLLQEVYGESMNRILHIGPSACSVVLKLLKEEKLEAWGILPFDPSPPIHSVCENLISKGLIRVADVTQPLHYRSRSFSIVLANDVVDTMTTKHLNVTLRELARVSSDSVVLFINSKTNRKLSNAGEGSKPLKTKPRSRLWWQHCFQMMGLQESEEATKRFEAIQTERSFKLNYYIFHLISSDIIR